MGPRQEAAADFAGPAGLGHRLLWAFERRVAANSALSRPVVARLRAPLAVAQFREAVERLVERHDSLRTRLVWRAPRLFRVVSPDWKPCVQVVDLSDEHDALAAAEPRLREELMRPFVAADWPLRALLVMLAPNDHIICLNIHHAATDAVSNGILLEELAVLLDLPAGTDRGSLQVDSWSYSQWVDWQIEQYQQALESGSQYWVKKLDGAQGPRLPGQPDPASDRVSGFAARTLGADMTASLVALSRSERASMFTVAIALFYLVMARATGQRDVTVTTLFSDRYRPEVVRTVGFFVSSVPLRVAVQPSETFSALIKRCRETILEAIQHQSVPLHMLPRRSRESGGARVDDVVFQLIEEPAATSGPFEPVYLTPDQGTGRTFDLEFVVHRRGQLMMVSILYGAHRFSADFMERLLADFVSLAERAATDPGQLTQALLAHAAAGA